VKARSALVYSVLRLLAFLVPFGILMLFPIMREYYWLAAIFAALIGLSLSVLFLRKPLEDATSGLAERRAQARTAATDEEVEDAAADAAAPTSPETDSPDDPA
jgi:ABC-type siderophore export system fused ATPase/permease subunit